MKKLAVILIATILAANVVSARNDDKKEAKSSNTSSMVKTIKGVVVDKTTGEGLAGASVMVNDKVIYTDFEGNFSVKLSEPKAKIRVGLISYSTTELEINKNLNELKVELDAVE
ncbi:carboxypeptidase-like regulatory domain-containing protein [Tenuifilum thalassicum]|uniref:Carboxypeptidase-like regulatory domain-containing protein n=1 Tax=Tenuifilum thalassicum TaxID=2590900 RepID=A0A7D3XMK7_9BACT|nr:carboxypeptidase-like regulatory domain-containing protein [Tenuifilum thalassicum]QKG80316.1 hypothetical protein FHG85_08595 [Tenuifilum thalassicum]